MIQVRLFSGAVLLFLFCFSSTLTAKEKNNIQEDQFLKMFNDANLKALAKHSFLINADPSMRTTPVQKMIPGYTHILLQRELNFKSGIYDLHKAKKLLQYATNNQPGH